MTVYGSSPIRGVRRQCLACREPYDAGSPLPLCSTHKAAHKRAARRRKAAQRRQLACWRAEAPQDTPELLREDYRVRMALRGAREAEQLWAWALAEAEMYENGIQAGKIADTFGTAQTEPRRETATVADFADQPAEGDSLSGQAYHAADHGEDDTGHADDARADGLDVFDHADELPADREAVHGAALSGEYLTAEDRQPSGTYTVDGPWEGVSAGTFEQRERFRMQAFAAANHPWWTKMPPEIVFYGLGELTVNDLGERVRELTADRLAECGTYAGWKAHRRRGEAPCEPCRQAKRERNRADYARRKAA